MYKHNAPPHSCVHPSVLDSYHQIMARFLKQLQSVIKQFVHRAKYTPAKSTPGSRQRWGRTADRPPPSRLPTRESQTSKKSEEEDIPRITYVPEEGYDTLTARRFREYLEDTEVEAYFHKLLRLLLDRPELPYNPYSGYVVRMRQRAEKFHMDFNSSEKIHSILWNTLQESYLPNLYTVKGFDNVWGLSSILRVVSPQTLTKYKWLLNDLTPHPEDVLSIADYTNQVMVALVGPCVFEGTFYSHVHNIQIRKEYLVSGPDVKTGLSLYINAVMAEIDGMYSNPNHIILGVNIPVQDGDNPDISIFDFWNSDKIQEEKQEFLQAMSDTVINNQYIHMECIFRIDPGYPRYMRGQVQFGLNFLEVVEDLKEEGMSSFCEFPMASLHEGVFLNRSHAESYISLFMPQFNPYEADTMQPPLPHTSQSSKSQRSLKGSQRTLSASQNQDMRTVRRHIYDRFQHVHPTKIRIDGFKIGDDTSYGPFAWQITTPIKSSLQKRIASYHLYAELFDAVYCVILLYLLDRDAYDAEIAVELYRLLHSTAGRFHAIMEQNQSLRYIVRGFSNTREINAIRENLALYKDAIKNLFLNNLHERSTEQITAGRVMVSQVDDLLPSEEIPFASSPHIQMTLKTLKNLNWYSLTLMLQLAEDCLGRCPILVGIIGTMKQTFPESIPQPLTRHRQKPDPEGIAIDSDVPHGVEDEHIKTHEKSVINVQTCLERETAPRAIAKEAVLLRYIVDTRMDKVWNDFLIDLAVADYFPPNPYPRLVSVLRKSAMNMDLRYTTKEAIEDSVVNSDIQFIDPENYVFALPGVDAYGTISSVSLLDIGQFIPLSQYIQNFVQLNYIQRKGPYRVGLCLAVSGPTILYGKTQPYLNEVELHEHCYIQGPPGCQGEAIQLFATIVHNHVQELVKSTNYLPVVGVFFGDNQTRWSWEDIVYKKMGFIGEFTTICARKEPIFLKAYVLVDQWRYVPVRKYFLLHFLTDDDIDGEIFYPDNPIAFYQSIFLSRDRAAFHFQNGGPRNGGDPMSGPNIRHANSFMDDLLRAAESRCDMLTLHRGLLLRSLLNQDRLHIAETWWMLHSIASQYEYMINYAESLQDLIQLTMEYEEYEEKESAKRAQTSVSQQSKPGTQQSKPATQQGKPGSKQSKPATQQTKPGTKGGKSQTGKSQTAKSIQNEKQELENPIDEGLIGKMTMAFLRKLSDICESRISLTSSALQEFVLNKMKSAIEEDFYTGNVYLGFDTQTMFRLEEVRQMLKMVQDSVAADVNLICTEAMATMDRLGKETKGRRTSITSTDLEEPYSLKKVPNAIKMQTILE